MDSRQGSVRTRTRIKTRDRVIPVIAILPQCSHTKPSLSAWHAGSAFPRHSCSLHHIPNNSQPSFTLLPRLSEQPSVDNPGCSHSWRIPKIERYKDRLWLPGGILEHPIFKIAVWCFFFCFVSVSKETSKNAVALQIHPQTRELLSIRHH